MGLRSFSRALALALLAAAALQARAGALLDVVSVSIGHQYACALTSAGGVKCWGRNDRGQLGDGTSTSPTVAVDVVGLSSGVAKISASEEITCAVMTSGSVKCWGSAGSELFRQDFPAGSRLSLVPIDMPRFGSGIADFQQNREEACLLTTAGAVRCWGANYIGQLGDGTTTARTDPVQVVGLGGGVRDLAYSRGTPCVLMNSGGVKCWGPNWAGQLGNGTTVDSPVPVDVLGLQSGVASLASGYQRSCAVLGDGNSRCWGNSPLAGVLDGTNAPFRSTPADVAVGAPVTSVAVGEYHTCVLLATGGVKCWGLNEHGEVGDGTVGTQRFSPVDVVGLSSGVVAISAKLFETCAIRADTSVLCWGQGIGAITAVPTLIQNQGTAQTIDFPALAPADIGASPFSISAAASSGLPVSFASETASVCSVARSTVTLHEVGICTIAASQPGDVTFIAASTRRSFLVTGLAAGAPTTLANLSTRMQVQGGANVLIVGFAISGPRLKTVLIRARGPSLAASGVAGFLPDPRLALHGSQRELLASNDDWQSHAQAAVIQSAGLAPADSRESAMLVTLGPGLYTAIASPGSAAASGVGIVEVFQIDHLDSALLNISTRGQVLTGEDVMIGGFIVQGNSPKTVVVRARGPSLSALGVPNALANPALRLVRSSDQSTVAINDNWGDAANAGAIAASGYAPLDAAESAILVTLPPGAYTAIVSGVGGTTGVGLVEVFAP